MKPVLIIALLLSACSGSAVAPVDNDAPAATAGTGIKIDSATGTISIDSAVVPTAPSCTNGQVVVRTATGWSCAAAAPDATMLGGKPAASYLTSDATASNASNLGGQPASFYLAATAQAADSAKLNGKSDAAFLAATATAADSANLGGQPASSYLTTSATAANSAKLGNQLPSAFLGAAAQAVDSAKLGGQPASSYLTTSATAANSAKLGNQLPSAFLGAAAQAVDSAKLGGQPPSAFLPANAQAQSAITANQLGGVGAASYFRNDVPNQTVPAQVTVGDPLGTRLILGANGTSDLFGSNSGFGNLHIDSDTNGSDGRIYLNWYSGKGVAIADGNQGEVASFDSTGNLKAASFNGMKIFRVSNSTATSGNSCDSICLNNPGQGGTCLSARVINFSGGTPNAATLCSTATPFNSTWSFSCMCSSF